MVIPTFLLGVPLLVPFASGATLDKIAGALGLIARLLL
jgi:hypothetical protein